MTVAAYGRLKRRQRERYKAMLDYSDARHDLDLYHMPPDTGRISKDEARRRIDTELPPASTEQ